jgi:hypothetical protein
MRYVFVAEEMFWSIRKVYDRIAPEWYQPRILKGELSDGFARFKCLLNDMPDGPLDWETADHAPCRVLYAYIPNREPRFAEAMIAIADLVEALGPKWVFEAEFEDESGIDLFVCKGLLHFRDTKRARKFAKAVCALYMQEQPSIERSDYPIVSEYDGLVRPNRYERLVKVELSWIYELGFEPGVMYGTKYNAMPAYDLSFDLRLDDSSGTSCVCALGVELGFNDHGSQGARLFWMTDCLRPMLTNLELIGFSSQLLQRPESTYIDGVRSRGITAYLVRGRALEFYLLGYGDPGEGCVKRAADLRGLDDGFWGGDEAETALRLAQDSGILFGEIRIASPQAELMESDLMKLGFKVIGEAATGLSRWLCDGRIVVELQAALAKDPIVPVFVAASLQDPTKLGAIMCAIPSIDANNMPAHELILDWGFGKGIVRTRASVETLRRIG